MRLAPERNTVNALIPFAERAAALLKSQADTIAVAESSTGGLISAALLAIPGASAYFVGGGVIYTATAQRALLAIPRELLTGIRASTEPYARLAAQTVRERLGTRWGIAETGATGPTGNPYGDAAGHSCIAVAGDGFTRSITVETGSADRVANMHAFSAAALELLVQCLEAG